jgi:heme oxygenase
MTIATTGAPLSLRLKEGTSALHNEAESKPFLNRVSKGDLPADAYADSLEQSLLIYREMEALARPLRPSFAPLATLVEDDHFHAERIEADLRHFGRDPRHAKLLTSTAAFLDKLRAGAAKNPAYLVGVFYVYEGSHNGGRFLAKRVRMAYNLAEEGRPGTQFMDPYGNDQPRVWRAFKEKLDSLGLSEEQMDAAVEAAKDVFGVVMAIGDEICALRDGAKNA